MQNYKYFFRIGENSYLILLEFTYKIRVSTLEKLGHLF